MNSSELSNSDLREALVQMGMSPGPITPSTRRVYEKQLTKFTTSLHSQESIVTTTSESSFTAVNEALQVEKTPSKELQSKVDKVLEITDNEHIESPYHYARGDFPVDDNLRRRPLYTPGGTVRTPQQTTYVSSSNQKKVNNVLPTAKAVMKDPKKKTIKSSSGFPWFRIVLGLLVIFLILIFLIYYHMEHSNMLQSITKQ